MIGIVDFIKDYGPVISWLMVIAGWLYADHKANDREHRKEIRDEIKEITSVVDKILFDLNRIYSQDGSTIEAKHLAQSIASCFVDIDERIQNLGLRKRKHWFRIKNRLDLDEVLQRSHAFYNSTSETDYGSQKRHADSSSSKLYRPKSNGLQLCSSLRAAFVKAFK